MNFGYLSVTVLLASIAIGGRAIAQVTGDPTLGAEGTVVNLVPGNGASTYTITGGATRGTSLFHSFDQFSIMAGDRAAFDNANQIENIIGRVTGANISNLDGIIQANGGANLFLINPAGIVLGPDARLDIGGSFVATTGQGISFDNGFTYDTTSPNVPPLLTISTPIGLLMGANPGNIQVMGQGGNTPPDFSVDPGQTLALVGGNVSLAGAQLTAAGGRLELGGVSTASELTLTPAGEGFDVGFDGVSAAGDILLSGQTVLDVSGPGGGTIELHGDDITLAGQSALVSDTLGGLDGQQIRVVAERFRLQDGSFIGAATSGSGNGSHIEIMADQEITLTGVDISNYKILQLLSLAGVRQISDRENSGLFAVTTGAGQAGNISLSTQNLLIDEGISVSTETLGAGDSGNIEVVATDSIRMRGSGIATNSIVPGVPLVDLQGTATGQSTVGIPAGAAGDVTINTTNLIVEDGGAIAAATQTDQDSGDVIITATDSLILRGFFKEAPIPTSITTVTIGGLGDAGNIEIE
ncbi:MAG: filamentous hemagglutinin N-terminal domain-containing protein, partial [Cyanobacteria bacterium P01_H01_bin.26]